MIKIRSKIRLAYLKGANCGIPANPSKTSANNSTRTMAAIESAAIHSPFCTVVSSRLWGGPKSPDSYSLSAKIYDGNFVGGR